MGKQQRSLRSKAAHLVADFTTVLLNPISDKPSKPNTPTGEETEEEASNQGSFSEEGSEFSIGGPDTSSFSAFLYSLIKDDYFNIEEGDEENTEAKAAVPELEPAPKNVVRESSGGVVSGGGGGRRGLLSRGKQSLGKAMYYAARFAGYRNSGFEKKGNFEIKNQDKNDDHVDGEEMRDAEDNVEELSFVDLPEMSEPSLLLSEKTRGILYGSLPALARGKIWVLLYSTWRHGISLSTLYRRSMLCPGLSLLVVGDRGGAVFGGLVEAPLRPRSKRYQGTNSTFLFTDITGQPVIYRPTGANRYYTLCSPEFLALGGGGHFALYLDQDLLTGSSSASETYGNSRLTHTDDFEVKEVELWGFVYASKYEETLALCNAEVGGICRW